MKGHNDTIFFLLFATAYPNQDENKKYIKFLINLLLRIVLKFFFFFQICRFVSMVLGRLAKLQKFVKLETVLLLSARTYTNLKKINPANS